MNTKTLLITTLLAIAVLSNITVGSSVYATGGLDDEEEEAAIEELQTSVGSINETLDKIELNLKEGSNNIQANCPVSTNEIVQEITEVIENVTASEEEEPASCPLVPEQPEQNQTALPPVEIPTTPEPEPEQNETSTALPECSPVPEPEEPEQLEPIICPLNGDLLGYKNITNGELLPISAVLEEQGNETIPFLPPIDIPSNETTTVSEPEPQP